MSFIPQETTLTWYAALEKPFFAPAPWVFGVAWSILYPIIVLSFALVFFRAYKKRIPRYVALPFLLNLMFNLTFSPIQFGLQNNFLAALDITAVLITLLWAMRVVYPYSRAIAYAQFPYLFWGAFATALQFSILYLNL